MTVPTDYISMLLNQRRKKDLTKQTEKKSRSLQTMYIHSYMQFVHKDIFVKKINILSTKKTRWIFGNVR